MGYVLKTERGGQIGFRIERDSGEPVEKGNRFLQTLWARALSPHTVRTFGVSRIRLRSWLWGLNVAAGLTGVL